MVMSIFLIMYVHEKWKPKAKSARVIGPDDVSLLYGDQVKTLDTQEKEERSERGIDGVLKAIRIRWLRHTL